ncbi:MarC family protein [Ameyamaea chiangmaiensis]|uniref:UPF0056 membrane protein n=1 Tax=Ameyamaea chiangmaiensis TaxID=442969 RepID=A0A850PEE9_9PROT|nr:MarC family protein [Ameyamaea chiangmaiensis]MBS4074340.1 MarC family protein [Ameyamaea chiangmaiensis]NVN40312.1 MarC family protein [Ameyamaea chiangmaiensis]
MTPSVHHIVPDLGLRSLSGAFLLAFPALFSIVNPIGAALIFAQATSDRTRAECLALARAVAFYSFLLLVVSIWMGGAVLAFFGITIDALRVAGGLVVAVRAWNLLQAPEAVEARKEEQALQGGRTAAAESWRDMAFFPLAMPFTVGPGSMSVAIALSSERPAHESMMAFFFGLTLASAGMAIVIWVAYSYAERLVSLLGRTGARIVSRLAALILLCIGVQILAGGIEGIVISTVHNAGF